MGAFGPNGGGVKTVTPIRTPAGSLIDHASHAATLASVYCVQPSYDPVAEAALDLPGPGAVTLEGAVQVQ